MSHPVLIAIFVVLLLITLPLPPLHIVLWVILGCMIYHWWFHSSNTTPPPNSPYVP